MIRLLVIITTAYFILFTQPGSEPKTWAYIFIAAYLATNLMVAAAPDRLFYEDRIFYALILCDSILLPAGIYLSGYAGSDLYLMYFFIVSLTTMSARFEYLMVNALIFSFIYGWILYQNGYLAGYSAITYGLRIPLVMAIAMFYGYLISARLKDKDDRIREAWQRYEQIVEATDLLMCIVDQNGILLFANQKFVKLYGAEDETSILGRSYFHFCDPPEETQDPLQHVKKVVQTNATVQYESHDKKRNRWFANTVSPISQPSAEAVFAVCIVSKDITERIEKEKELNDTVELLRRTRDQLIQKDKMAALGRMASGIAHEIRNPLEIISMGVDYLDYNLPEDNPNLQKSIEKIYNAINRSNKIIKDILSFSRQSDFQITNVRICPLVDNTLSLARHNIRKTGVKMHREFENELIEVSADYNMLEQVLLNLVNNAVDAMKDREEKRLDIRVYKQKVTQIEYKTGYRRADFFTIGDEMVVVEISDSGKGIAEDVLPKIFEPFFTTKPTDEGTGLGLSLAHMIMDRLSGIIDVQSTENIGTTFFVKLQPASQKAVSAAADA